MRGLPLRGQALLPRQPLLSCQLPDACLKDCRYRTLGPTCRRSARCRDRKSATATGPPNMLTHQLMRTINSLEVLSRRQAR